jgi:hypothetical protein
MPDATLRAYAFKGGILENLPRDVKLSDNDDVRRVQAEARTLVRAEALARTQRTVPLARSLSDFARVNRVEGLAIGAGIARLLGQGFTVGGRARFGFADHAFKETGSMRWQRASGAGVSVSGGDDFREAGDAPEASGVRNSIAAQEFGTDLTDYYRTRGATVTVDAGDVLGARWRLSIGRERQDPLAVHARPVSGSYAPALPTEALDAWRVAIDAFRAQGAGPLGSTLAVGGTVLVSRVRFVDGPAATRSGSDLTFGRVAVDGELERQLGADRLSLHAIAATAVGDGVPVQSLVAFGGPVTGPGYDFHQFRAERGMSARVEWEHPVVNVPLALGRYGRLAMPISLAPFAQGIWMGGMRGSDGGWFPALGVGVITAFDLLRFDVARGMRDGRWTFGVDVGRGFWRIL